LPLAEYAKYFQTTAIYAFRVADNVTRYD